MPHRYFTRELADGRAALTGSDAHHLADVMRARIGEEVVLCGPDGLEYLGTVTAIEPGRVEFSVTDGTTSKAEPDCAVTLFAGYPKAGKLEEVIRHSVELGVTEVVPFFSRYCVATTKKEDVKNERYNRIAAEAAKQAGRAMLPHVALPLNDFAAVCKAFTNFDVVLFFYEGGGIDVGATARGLGQTVAQRVFGAQGREARVAQLLGHAAGGDGDSGVGADYGLPGDVVNAVVQLIGILRLKAPEYHEHAARQARPQTGAVALLKLALKRGAALQAADMRKPEAFKLIGECGLKALGAACVKFHG